VLLLACLLLATQAMHIDEAEVRVKRSRPADFVDDSASRAVLQALEDLGDEEAEEQLLGNMDV